MDMKQIGYLAVLLLVAQFLMGFISGFIPTLGNSFIDGFLIYLVMGVIVLYLWKRSLSLQPILYFAITLLIANLILGFFTGYIPTLGNVWVDGFINAAISAVAILLIWKRVFKQSAPTTTMLG